MQLCTIKQLSLSDTEYQDLYSYYEVLPIASISVLTKQHEISHFPPIVIPLLINHRSHQPSKQLPVDKTKNMKTKTILNLAS